MTHPPPLQCVGILEAIHVSPRIECGSDQACLPDRLVSALLLAHSKAPGAWAGDYLVLLFRYAGFFCSPLLATHARLEPPIPGTDHQRLYPIFVQHSPSDRQTMGMLIGVRMAPE